MNTIVFSRVWNPAHIKTALRNARLHCPDCRVVHLHCVKSGVGWDDACDVGAMYNVAMADLQRGEAMWGPGDKSFKKVCVARWAVLRAWMEGEGLEEVCHCDSDVLLFDDPFKSPHYEKGKLHVSDNHNGCVHAGHSIVNMEALDAFWTETQHKMDGLRAEYVSTAGDMIIWTDVAHAIGFVDQNQIKDGVAFDHHLGVIDGWDSEGGFKKLEWRDGKPYGWRGDWAGVRLLNLHCWNESEERMEEYAKLGGLEI